MQSRPMIFALAAAMGLAAASAQADYRPGFADKAQVISSTPVYDRVNEPRRECWSETVGYDEQLYRSRNANGGAIFGAITGGLLGSTVGRGSGRVAVAAIGTVTGAVIGDRIDSDDHYYRSIRPRQVEHCQVSDNFRNVVVAFDVVYRYRGLQYSTRLAHDPGRRLDVNVNVSPRQQTPYFRDPNYDYRRKGPNHFVESTCVAEVGRRFQHRGFGRLIRVKPTISFGFHEDRVIAG